MMATRRKLAISTVLLLGLLLTFSYAAAQGPIIRAVYFYSPTCGHCHKVSTEDLPPLIERYGEQLEILYVDVNTFTGQQLYQSAVERFQIPEPRLGVPTIVVADTVLVGSQEIPEMFPVLIEQGLVGGGISWPEIPGMDGALSEFDFFSLETAAAIQGFPVLERVGRDPLGNGLAILILAGMIVVFVRGLAQLGPPRGMRRKERRKLEARFDANWKDAGTVLLSLIGIGIAGYLTFAEATGSNAVCGPVGECNLVQQSEYAQLFGIIPVGALGIVGFGAVLVSWVIARLQSGNQAAYAVVIMLGLAGAGTLFSIYLTFLEPFVIGATCAWCLGSALAMTGLFWLAVSPGRLALTRLRAQ